MRLGEIIFRDAAAHHDPGTSDEAWIDRLADDAADIFEIDVYALRTGRREAA